MQILFLTHVLPLPLDAGPKIRAHYVLRHLAESGHEVTLVSLIRPTERQTDVQALARFCRSVESVPITRSRLKDVLDGLASLLSGQPFLIRRDQFPALDLRVQRLLEGRTFDAVHADQLWMASCAVRCTSGLLRVLDQHNAVFRVPERLSANQTNPVVRALLRREAAKLFRYECATLERFDRVVWVSEDDRAAFPPLGPSPRRESVIPIGVDPSVNTRVERKRPFRVTFVGGIHWPPNAEAVRWFARRVWPLVASAVPDCVFTVIGKGSPTGLGHASRMVVTGYVSDPRAYLEETAAFVVPLLTGAGMRVKILDAWCWAIPVVSTRIGAEGLAYTDGQDILIGDEPAAFAEHVIRILRDHREARRIGENGRATVEARYDWRKIYAAWDDVYR